MNKIFKVIWNKTKCCYVVASEVAKANGRCKSSNRRRRFSHAALAATIFSSAAVVSLPAEMSQAAGTNYVANRYGSVTTYYYTNGNHGKPSVRDFQAPMPPGKVFQDGDGWKHFVALNPQVNDGSSDAGLQSDVSEVGDQSVAIGFKTKAIADYAVALGTNAQSVGQQGISIGDSVVAQDDNTIGIGTAADAYGRGSVAIGMLASTKTRAPLAGTMTGGGTPAQNATAIGANSMVGQNLGVALGSFSMVNAQESLGAGLNFGSPNAANDTGAYTPNGIVSIGTAARQYLDLKNDNMDHDHNLAVESTTRKDKGYYTANDEYEGYAHVRTTPEITRRIKHLAAGVDSTDAVNVAQLQSLANNKIVLEDGHGNRTTGVALGDTSPEHTGKIALKFVGKDGLETTVTGDGTVNIGLSDSLAQTFNKGIGGKGGASTRNFKTDRGDVSATGINPITIQGGYNQDDNPQYWKDQYKHNLGLTSNTIPDNKKDAFYQEGLSKGNIAVYKDKSNSSDNSTMHIELARNLQHLDSIRIGEKTSAESQADGDNNRAVDDKYKIILEGQDSSVTAKYMYAGTEDNRVAFNMRAAERDHKYNRVTPNDVQGTLLASVIDPRDQRETGYVFTNKVVASDVSASTVVTGNEALGDNDVDHSQATKFAGSAYGSLFAGTTDSRGNFVTTSKLDKNGLVTNRVVIGTPNDSLQQDNAIGSPQDIVLQQAVAYRSDDQNHVQGQSYREITGLTNTNFNPNSADFDKFDHSTKAATEAQLKQSYTILNNQLNKINKGGLNVKRSFTADDKKTLQTSLDTAVGVKGADANIQTSIDGNNIDVKLAADLKGLNSVETKTVKATTVNGDTVNATTVNATTVGGDTINGKKVNATTVKATTVDGDTVNATTVNATTVKGDTFNGKTVNAGNATINNITVPGDGGDNIVINKTGINNGGKTITNVADGTKEHDVATVGQVERTVKTTINNLKGQNTRDFSTDNGTVNAKLGDTVAVKGGANIKTAGSGKTITVDLSDTLTGLQSVTASTVKADNIGAKDIKTGDIQSSTATVNTFTVPGADGKNIVISSTGIDNGGKKITNLADGTSDTDAVTVGQLNKEIIKTTKKNSDDTDKKIKAAKRTFTADDNKTLQTTLDTAVGVKGADANIKTSIDGNNIAVKLASDLKGLNSVTANTVHAGTVAANAVNANAITVAGPKNGKAMSLGNGTITGLTNTTWTDGYKTDDASRAATEGELHDLNKIISDTKTAVSGGWTVQAGESTHLASSKVDGKHNTLSFESGDQVAFNLDSSKNVVTASVKDGANINLGEDSTVKVSNNKRDIVNDGDTHVATGGDIYKAVQKEHTKVTGEIKSAKRTFTADDNKTLQTTLDTAVGVKGADANIQTSIKDNNIEVKLASDLKGLNSVETKTVKAGTVNATTVDGDTINGKTVNATTVKATTVNGDTINGKTVNATTVKATTVEGDTITGKTVNATTVNATTVKGDTITGKTVNATTVKATTVDGDTVNATTVNATTVKGDTINGKTVNANNATIKNITVPGDDGNNIVINNNGINNGGKTITNVADGTNEHDVATVGQVKTTIKNLKGENTRNFSTDNGSVNAKLGETVEVKGGANIKTAGSGKTITVNLSDTLTGLKSVTADTFNGKAVNATTVKATTVDGDTINGKTVNATTVKATTVTGDTLNGNTVNATTVNSTNVKADNIGAKEVKTDDLKSTTATISTLTVPGADGKNIVIGSTGIDNGGKKITNLAEGTSDTDAVTVGQLNKEIIKTSTKNSDDTDKKIKAAKRTFTADDNKTLQATLGTAVGVKGADANIQTSIEGNNIAVKLASDLKGLNSVTANTVNAGTVAANAVSANAVSAKTITVAAPKNGKAMSLGNGTITGLTNTTWTNGYKTDDVSRAATEGELHDLNTIITDTQTAVNGGWTVKAGESTNLDSSKVDAQHNSLSFVSGDQVAFHLDASKNAVTAAVKDGATINLGENSTVKVTNPNRDIVTDGNAQVATGGDIYKAVQKEHTKVTGEIKSAKRTFTADDNKTLQATLDTAVGVKGADSNISTAIKDNNIEVKLASDLTGLNSVTAKTVNADTVKAKNVSATSVNATTVTGDTINGKTVNADTVKAKNVSATSVNATTVTGDTINGKTVNADNATVKTITVPGADGKNIVISKTGIDNGGKIITDLADGTKDHDAATVGQVNRTVQTTINNLKGQNTRDFSTDNGNVNATLSDTVAVKGGANIKTAGSGKTITVNLSDTLTGLQSVTADTINGTTVNASTVKADNIGAKEIKTDDIKSKTATVNTLTVPGADGKNIVIGSNGIDNGGKKITNLADGTADSDAVTVGQLNKEIIKTSTKNSDDTDKKIKAAKRTFTADDNKTLQATLGTAVGVKGADSNIQTSIEGNNIAVKLASDLKGLNSVTANTVNAGTVAANEVSAKTITVAAPKNGKAMSLGSGTITGLTNTTWTNGYKTDDVSRAATEGELHDLNTIINNTQSTVNSGWTVKAGESTNLTTSKVDSNDNSLSFVSGDQVAFHLDASKNAVTAAVKDGATLNLGENSTVKVTNPNRDIVTDGNAQVATGGDIYKAVQKEHTKVTGEIKSAKRTFTADDNKTLQATLDTAVGVKGADANIQTAIKDNNIEVKLASDLKGLNSVEAKTVKADTVNAGTVNANAVKATTVNATTVTGDTINGKTVNADTVKAKNVSATTVNATTVTGDTINGKTVNAKNLKSDNATIKAITVPGADGKNIVISSTGIDNGGKTITDLADGVHDHDAATVGQVNRTVQTTINNLKGQNTRNFSTDDGSVNATLSDTVAVKGGANIKTAGSGKTITVNLSDTLTGLKAVTADTLNGKTVNADTVKAKTVTAETANATTVNATTVNATTVKADNIGAKEVKTDDLKSTTATISTLTVPGADGKNIVIGSNGIDNGGKKITNLADGTADTDAVTVGQLNKEIIKTSTKNSDDTDKKIKAAKRTFTADDNKTLQATLGTAVGVKGADSNIQTSIEGNNIAVKLASDLKGLNSVTANTVNAGTVAANAVNANAITVAGPKNGKAMSLGNGTITGLTNTTWTDGYKTDDVSRAATEGELHDINTLINNTQNAVNNGWTVKAGESNALTTSKVNAQDNSLSFVSGDQVAFHLDASKNAVTAAVKDGATINLGENSTVKVTNPNRDIVTDGNAQVATGGDIYKAVQKEHTKVTGEIKSAKRTFTADDNQTLQATLDTAVGVKGADANIQTAIKDNNIEVKLASDLKGLNSVEAKTVKADTVNAGTVNADAVKATTVNATTVTGDTINGKTVNADTVKAKNVSATSVNATTVTGDTINGKTVNADNATVKTITVPGADGKNIVISSTGIDNGGKTITDLADGVHDHDAATVGQVNRTVQTTINNLKGQNTRNFSTDNGNVNATLSDTVAVKGGANIKTAGSGKTITVNLSDTLTGLKAVTADTLNGKTVNADTVKAKTVTAETANATTVNATTVNATTVKADNIGAKEVKTDDLKSTTATISTLTVPGADGKNIVIGSTGIDNGGKKITNLADGTADTDAVTVGQLNKEIIKTTKKNSDDTDKKIKNAKRTFTADDNQTLQATLGTAVGVKGADANIKTSISGNDILVQLSPTLAGLSSVTADEINAGGLTAKEITVAAPVNGQALKLGNGEITGLSNTSWTMGHQTDNVSRAATEGELQDFDKAVGKARQDLNAGWNLNLPNAQSINVNPKNNNLALQSSDDTIAISKGQGSSVDLTVKKGATVTLGGGSTIVDNTQRHIVKAGDTHIATGSDIFNADRKFTGDDGKVVNPTVGGTLTITGGESKAAALTSTEDKNIGVIAGDNNKLKVLLSKEIKGLRTIDVGDKHSKTRIHISDGKDGKDGITINGKDGMAGLNGKDGLTIKGKDGQAGLNGKDGLTIKGKDGQVGLNGKDGLTIKGKDGMAGLNGKDGLTIKGKDGQAGLNGKDGLTIKGKDGQVGLNGKDGLTINGKDGQAGLNGKDGLTIKGKDGQVGLNGKDGLTINGKDGMADLNGKDGLTIKGKDGQAGVYGKDGLTIKGKDGQAGLNGKDGLTINGKDGSVGLNGKDGLTIKGKDGTSIQITSKGIKGGNAYTDFSGDLASSPYGTPKTRVALGEGIALTGGFKAAPVEGKAATNAQALDQLTKGNIAVVNETTGKDHKLEIRLAKNIKGLEGVQVGNAGSGTGSTTLSQGKVTVEGPGTSGTTTVTGATIESNQNGKSTTIAGDQVTVGSTNAKVTIDGGKGTVSVGGGIVADGAHQTITVGGAKGITMSSNTDEGHAVNEIKGLSNTTVPKLSDYEKQNLQSVDMSDTAMVNKAKAAAQAQYHDALNHFAQSNKAATEAQVGQAIQEGHKDVMNKESYYGADNTLFNSGDVHDTMNRNYITRKGNEMLYIKGGATNTNGNPYDGPENIKTSADAETGVVSVSLADKISGLTSVKTKQMYTDALYIGDQRYSHLSRSLLVGTAHGTKIIEENGDGTEYSHDDITKQPTGKSTATSTTKATVPSTAGKVTVPGAAGSVTVPGTGAPASVVGAPGIISRPALGPVLGGALGMPSHEDSSLTSPRSRRARRDLGSLFHSFIATPPSSLASAPESREESPDTDIYHNGAGRQNNLAVAVTATGIHGLNSYYYYRADNTDAHTALETNLGGEVHFVGNINVPTGKKVSDVVSKGNIGVSIYEDGVDDYKHTEVLIQLAKNIHGVDSMEVNNNDDLASGGTTDIVTKDSKRVVNGGDLFKALEGLRTFTGDRNSTDKTINTTNTVDVLKMQPKEALSIVGGAQGALTDNNLGTVVETKDRDGHRDLAVKLAADLHDLNSIDFEQGGAPKDAKHRTATLINKNGILAPVIQAINGPRIVGATVENGHKVDGGIDMNGGRITNLAPGINPSDAATVSQVQDAESTAVKGSALSAALSGLSEISYDPTQPTQLMGAFGHYKDESAVALGLAHYRNDSQMFHGGLAYAGRTNFMWNLGFTLRFGTAHNNNINYQKWGGSYNEVKYLQSTVQELKGNEVELRKELAAQKAVIAKEDAQNKMLTAKINQIMEMLSQKSK